ncbi:MAG: proton-conducting transporter membrane subunit [Candidatus Aenigmarchaeota archaeon]|nr:proton-conducting transporter membrane subunit [Candidatus Aenigmarchaeota archaeon]
MLAPYAVPLLICTAFALPVFKNEKLIKAIAILAIFLSLSFVLSSSIEVFNSGTKVFAVSGFKAPFGIVMVLDKFSSTVASLILFLSLMIAAFSSKLVKERVKEFYTLLLLGIVGSLGIVITGDIFNMFVFTEIMNIATYALIGFTAKKEGLEASFKYLIIGSVSAVLMLLAISLLYSHVGTLNMADIISRIDTNDIYLKTIFIMLILSFCVKIAVFPFYVWKPDVISGSLEPVAAFFIGVMTTTTVYVIIRIFYTILGIYYSTWFSIIAIVTMIVGSFLALLQKDIKRILAYGSISQLGYIFLAFSTGLAFQGMYHLVNNAIIEVLLFLSIGTMLMHKKMMEKISMYAFLLGALSLIGIPPLSAFFSKFFIITGLLEKNLFIYAIISGLISIVTLLYYMKIYFMLKQGEKKIYWPIIILIIAVLLLSFVPVWLQIFKGVEVDLLARNEYVSEVLRP